jgi:hypothetical protein
MLLTVPFAFSVQYNVPATTTKLMLPQPGSLTSCTAALAPPPLPPLLEPAELAPAVELAPPAELAPAVPVLLALGLALLPQPAAKPAIRTALKRSLPFVIVSPVEQNE